MLCLRKCFLCGQVTQTGATARPRCPTCLRRWTRATAAARRARRRRRCRTGSWASCQSWCLARGRCDHPLCVLEAVKVASAAVLVVEIDLGCTWRETGCSAVCVCAGSSCPKMMPHWQLPLGITTGLYVFCWLLPVQLSCGRVCRARAGRLGTRRCARWWLSRSCARRAWTCLGKPARRRASS